VKNRLKNGDFFGKRKLECQKHQGNDLLRNLVPHCEKLAIWFVQNCRSQNFTHNGRFFTAVKMRFAFGEKVRLCRKMFGCRFIFEKIDFFSFKLNFFGQK
jgi:hypothetical protein